MTDTDDLIGSYVEIWEEGDLLGSGILKAVGPDDLDKEELLEKYNVDSWTHFNPSVELEPWEATQSAVAEYRLIQGETCVILSESELLFAPSGAVHSAVRSPTPKTELKGYSILQRPCPNCGHEQYDTVMEHSDLVKNEIVEAICTECGESYAKPIFKDGESKEIPRWRR